MAQLTIHHLPTEMLIDIFGKLDVGSRNNIRQTSRRHKNIIDVWHPIEKEPVVTNQISPQMIKRSFRILDAEEKLRVSRNWEAAVCRKRRCSVNRGTDFSCFKLQSDVLWCSIGNQISAFQRDAARGANFRRTVHNVTFDPDETVMSFAVQGNTLMALLRPDILWVGTITGGYSIVEQDVKRISRMIYVTCFDLYEDLVVIGSTDSNVGLYKLSESGVGRILNRPIGWNVSKVAFCPDGSKVALRETKGFQKNGLVLVDTSRGFDGNHLLRAKWRKNVQDLGHLKWDTPQLLWISTGSSCLQYWDTRTARAEQEIVRPYHYDITGFDLDHRNTVITVEVDEQTLDKRAVLWDVRQTKPVQEYLLQRNIADYSHGGNIAFDADYLFTSYRNWINILDFSSPGQVPK